MATVYRTNAAVVPRTGTEVRGPQARQLLPGGQRSAARCEPIHLVATRLGYFRPMSHRLSDTLNSPAIARPDTGSACSATARNTANRFSPRVDRAGVGLRPQHCYWQSGTYVPR